MNEINPKPEYWVLSLSGGKDSTALGLEWLARHKADPVTYPLHEVVYCDTWMEFPAMMEHINQLEKIFMDAEIKFTRLKSEKSFEEIMFERPPKRWKIGRWMARPKVSVVYRAIKNGLA